MDYGNSDLTLIDVNDFNAVSNLLGYSSNSASLNNSVNTTVQVKEIENLKDEIQALKDEINELRMLFMEN